ncbi:MAG: DUF4783 domain-containing protein [Runella sp.]
MKFLQKLTLGCFFIVVLSSFSHSYWYPNLDAEVAERVKGSFRTGDARLLSAHFERNLELVIDTERIDFKRVRHEQAELILKTFFKKYPPKDFRYGYQGTASNVRYCTATYQSSNGTKFQVYILMRITDRDYLINTLHFKKE